MKRPTDAPFKQPMRFFTPDLYLRFNSPGDEIANEADEAWEEALARYQRHLETIQDQMPQQARALTELCLHDCEVLGWDEAMLPDLRATSEPLPVWSAFSVLSVRRDSEVFSLNYVLWDKVRRYPAPDGWPFSKSRPHWLYDEVDVAAGASGRFLHRILFSDGTTAEVPFAIGFVHTVAWERSAGDVEHAGRTIDCG
jgi:hypothetical protein